MASGVQLGSSATCCAGGVLELNPAEANRLGFAEFMSELFARRFSAEFRYKIGPNTTGGEGLVFAFYKQWDYAPVPGSGLGFDDSDATTSFGHAGFGLELDGAANLDQLEVIGDAHIGLIKDGASTPVWKSDALPYADGEWHTITLDALEHKIVVYQDGQYIGTANIGQPQRTFGGIGFTASSQVQSGLAGYNYHQIDYLRVSVPDGAELTGCDLLNQEFIDLPNTPLAYSEFCPELPPPQCPSNFFLDGPNVRYPPTSPLLVSVCPLGPIIRGQDLDVVITTYSQANGTRSVTASVWGNEIVEIPTGTLEFDVPPNLNAHHVATVRLPSKGVALIGVNASMPEGAWFNSFYVDLDATPPTWSRTDPRTRIPLSLPPTTPPPDAPPAWLRPDWVPEWNDTPSGPQTIAWAQDVDADGINSTTEFLCGSSALVTPSTCASDDDRDGTPNEGEWAFRSACSGAYGIVISPQCGGYMVPSTCPNGWVLACPSGNPNQTYVWDPFCGPVQAGDYDTCAATSNFDGTRANQAVGPENGWGFRLVLAAAPTYSVYTCYAADADGDRIVRVVLCAQPGYYDQDGHFEPTGPAEPVGDPLGDPDDTDPANPLSLPAGGGEGSGSAPENGKPGAADAMAAVETVVNPSGSCSPRNDGKISMSFHIMADNQNPLYPDQSGKPVRYAHVEVTDDEAWGKDYPMSDPYTDLAGDLYVEYTNYDGWNAGGLDPRIRIKGEARYPGQSDLFLQMIDSRTGWTWSQYIILKDSSGRTSNWPAQHCSYSFRMVDNPAPYYMMSRMSLGYMTARDNQYGGIDFDAGEVNVWWGPGYEACGGGQTCFDGNYHFHDNIRVNGYDDFQDQWDTDVLLHEMAHHMMFKTFYGTHYPSNSDGSHTFLPQGDCQKPHLAWTEGFANFYQAATQNQANFQDAVWTWESNQRVWRFFWTINIESAKSNYHYFGYPYNPDGTRTDYGWYDWEGTCTNADGTKGSTEMSVMGTLWDVFDANQDNDGNTLGSDNLNMGIDEILWTLRKYRPSEDPPVVEHILEFHKAWDQKCCGTHAFQELHEVWKEHQHGDISYAY